MVAADLLIKPRRADTVERGKLGIEQHPVPAQDQNEPSR